MSAITPPISRRTRAATPRPRSRAHVAPGETAKVTPRARVAPVRAGVFGIFIGVILLIGLLAMLLINTSLAQGAFRVSELNRQATELTQQQQALQKLVSEQQTPAVLEQRARSLGMIPHSVPAFLRLSDGAILGEPTPQPAQAQVATSDSALFGTSTPTQWTPWIERGVAP